MCAASSGGAAVVLASGNGEQADGGCAATALLQHRVTPSAISNNSSPLYSPPHLGTTTTTTTTTLSPQNDIRRKLGLAFGVLAACLVMALVILGAVLARARRRQRNASLHDQLEIELVADPEESMWAYDSSSLIEYIPWHTPKPIINNSTIGSTNGDRGNDDGSGTRESSDNKDGQNMTDD